MDFTIDDDLRVLADKVISESEDLIHLKDDGCRIAYLKSRKNKHQNGKIIFADCEKLKDKIKAVLPYDFIITVYKDADYFDDKRMYILMYHELLHVGYKPNGDCKIIPHDIEDFRVVLEKYGLNWQD